MSAGTAALISSSQQASRSSTRRRVIKTSLRDAPCAKPPTRRDATMVVGAEEVVVGFVEAEGGLVIAAEAAGAVEVSVF